MFERKTLSASNPAAFPSSYGGEPEMFRNQMRFAVFTACFGSTPRSKSLADISGKSSERRHPGGIPVTCSHCLKWFWSELALHI